MQLFNYFLKKKSGMLGRNKPYIFSFVRHPFSWLESWFKYMSQPAQNWLNWGSEYDMHKWHPNSILNEVGDPDFNQFIRNVIMKRPGYVTELFGWYTTPEVDFVGKQENIRTDLIHVLKELNLDFDENIILRYPMVGVSKKL
ncbi:MAG TPA: hypothetical protein DCX53_14425, partial [Anaerolineae bacterium]|nr:hypothetical protein [Anaerolineae bacterium]